MMKPIYGKSSVDHLIKVITQPYACTHVWFVNTIHMLECRVCRSVLLPAGYTSVEDLQKRVDKQYESYERAMKGI